MMYKVIEPPNADSFLDSYPPTKKSFSPTDLNMVNDVKLWLTNSYKFISGQKDLNSQYRNYKQFCNYFNTYEKSEVVPKRHMKFVPSNSLLNNPRYDDYIGSILGFVEIKLLVKAILNSEPKDNLIHDLCYITNVIFRNPPIENFHFDVVRYNPMEFMRFYLSFEAKALKEIKYEIKEIRNDFKALEILSERINNVQHGQEIVITIGSLKIEANLNENNSLLVFLESEKARLRNRLIQKYSLNEKLVARFGFPDSQRQDLKRVIARHIRDFLLKNYSEIKSPTKQLAIVGVVLTSLGLLISQKEYRRNRNQRYSGQKDTYSQILYREVHKLLK